MHTRHKSEIRHGVDSNIIPEYIIGILHSIWDALVQRPTSFLSEIPSHTTIYDISLNCISIPSLSVYIRQDKQSATYHQVHQIVLSSFLPNINSILIKPQLFLHTINIQGIEPKFITPIIYI